MPKDLHIDEITIEGFRGFNSPQTLKFNNTSTIISGNMGTGKTSTLCAIEWALYGDIAYLICPKTEGATKQHFVNANKIDQKARVTIKLKGKDGNYLIQREKQAKTRDTYLSLETPDGKFEGDEAADKIYSLIGTFDDYHRSIFLHQEAVRAILTEDPEKRDLALDRLFGLERTRELMTAIPVNKVKREHEDLEDKKTKIELTIQGATKQAEVEMERAKNEAMEIGLKEKELNIREGIKKLNEIKDDTIKACEDCGTEIPVFIDANNEGDVSKALKKVKETLKDCRMQIAATSKYNELQQKEKMYAEAIDDLEKALIDEKEDMDEIKKMERACGSISDMENQERKLKEKEEKVKKEMETIDNRSRLITDAIDIFSTEPLKNCPVCDAKISSKEVLNNLEKRVNKDIQNRITILNRDNEKIRDELLEIKDNKTQLGKARSSAEISSKAREKAENSLREIINSKQKKSKEILKEAGIIITKVQEELKKVEKTLTEKTRILQEIEDKADICRAIVKVIQKTSEYEKIKETYSEENSQIDILNTQITEMAKLFTRLQRISDAVATAQINLARNFIGKGEKEMSNYYNQLCNHPFYNSIRIDIEQRNVKGTQKNTYNIRAFNNKEGKDTLISTRFSTGQMNCAALSIFLSLSSMLDRRPGFIILDDPSQSLDLSHKKALVEVLNKMCPENQLIIASQDFEFETELDTNFKPKQGLVKLDYKEWDKDGPRIECENKGA